MLTRLRHRPPARLDQSVTGVLARFAALATIAVAVLVATIVWRSATYEQTRTLFSAGQALQLSNAGMLDEETGLRGYLARHDAVLLQPYTSGEDELNLGDLELQRLLGAAPDTVGLLVELRLAQQAWLTRWADAALQGPPDATLTAFLEQGKTLFDAYRGAETALQNQLDSDIRQIEDRSSTIATGALAIEAVLIGAGALLWLRSRRQLRRGIVGPVTDILETLERFESGDYAPPAEPAEGPAELHSIGARLSGLGAALDAARAAAVATTRDAAEHAARLRRIVDMGREISGSLSLRYVLDAVSTSVLGIGIASRCVIWLTDEEGGTLVPAHDSAGDKGRVAGLVAVRLGDELVGKAARFGRILGPEAVSHPEVSDPWPLAMAIPMIVGARVIGVIEAGSADSPALPTHVMEVVATLASQAATALEAARLYERAEHLGRTDALTQLPNRRELDMALAAETSRAARYSRPFSIAMFDLDHFKIVNDTYGHARGDEILQQAAAVMRGALRETDTIYRYGGEEFLVVMPETTKSAAAALCDRVRKAVSDGVAVPDSGPRMTVSCGVAAFLEDGTEVAQLLQAADRALYVAKRAGRNRVQAAEQAPDLPFIGPLRVGSRA